jgi:hypothetical protein
VQQLTEKQLAQKKARLSFKLTQQNLSNATSSSSKQVFQRPHHSTLIQLRGCVRHPDITPPIFLRFSFPQENSFAFENNPPHG